MNHLSEVQIDGAAIRHNSTALRSLAKPGTEMVAVVKANAYGHGLTEVVTALGDLPDAFQVDDIEELRELRAHTHRPALVLGYVAQADLAEAVALGSELGVWDIERVAALNDIAQAQVTRARVHLKVDSLLGRLGMLPDALLPFVAQLAEYPFIEVVGIYGHYANIEDTTDLAHATAQYEAFRTVASGKWHHSATSGLMTMEQLAEPGALVRVGIGLYGIYPSASLARSFGHLALRPALRWVSHLAQVKVLPKGHPVGYGLTYITPREMRIGIVPQGYSDGYDRGLSSAGEVLVRGQRCPVLGRVAMNMFAIDLSAVPSYAEDEVVLLGPQGDDRITAEEIAARIGTIAYEVVARVSPRLPRVLL
jgi:alanine racemase